MPHNHPPVDQGPPKPSPEALAQVAALEKQLKEKPNDDSTKVHLADLYLDVGRYPEAVTLFRDVLGNRSNAELQMRLASAIAATGDNDGAIAEIARVAKAEPNNQRAGLAMAAMYVNKRDLDSLTIWLNRVYAIDSTSEAGQQAAMFLEKIKDLPRK
jgi:predicted Zn-dependent protease